jgi:hypothetical protein
MMRRDRPERLAVDSAPEGGCPSHNVGVVPALPTDGPLDHVEIERLLSSISKLLTDPAPSLSAQERLRWEGALVACEVILGRRPSLSMAFKTD